MTQPSDTPAPPLPSDPWALARRDYMAGMSGPVVAERHGLPLRTLRHRAAREEWRRSDLSAADALPSSRPIGREEFIEEFPELAAIDAAASLEKLDLLIDPDPRQFRQVAFRRAAEAAAMNRPHDASAWMRLVVQIGRAEAQADFRLSPYSAADYIRAGYLSQVRADEDAAAQPPGEDAG
jgi:hypothetical protein